MKHATLAVLLTSALAPAAWAQDPPTQIHLSTGADPSTQTVVMWRTASNTAAHVVQYGTTPAMGSSASGTSAPAPGTSGTIHTVLLGGLAPDTIYYYVCGDPAAGWSMQQTFRTAGPRDIVIAAYGDQGTSSAAVAVENLVNSHAPDLVVVAGDLGYANGTQSVWDTWFNLIQPVAARVPHLPALGNHEAYYSGDLAAYLGRFTLPNNERWYSVRYGNVHLAVIDSQSSVDPGSPQYDWFVRDLAQAVADGMTWKIVMMHYATWTSGDQHASDGDAIRTHLGPFMDAYHADLVLAGHVHNYERSHPMHSDGRLDPTGSVYIVAGTGGNGLYGFQSTQPAWSAAREMMYGFTKIDVSPGSMTLQSIRTDGAVRDTFMIVKPPDTIPPEVTISASGGVVTARAADNQGVTRVEFWVDGTLAATDTLAPFEATLDTSRSIVAKAYDGAGNVGTSASGVQLVARESVWKYNDLGQDLGTAWRTSAYDDAAWASGPGILGFGEPYVATPVASAPLTTYFRRAFQATGELGALTLSVKYDDGFVAHLNGTEVARANMPGGAPSTSTLASSTIEAGDYASFAVDPALVVAGTNVLAVEVHQASTSSSDLIFDAELAGRATEIPPIVVEVPSSGGGRSGGKCGLLGAEALLALLAIWRLSARSSRRS